MTIKTKAYLVHLLTATGAVLAMLAMLEIGLGLDRHTRLGHDVLLAGRRLWG